MASFGDVPPVRFFPRDEEGLLYHAAVYPLMNAEQKRWLQAGLARLYPGGHAWRGTTAREK